MVSADAHRIQTVSYGPKKKRCIILLYNSDAGQWSRGVPTIRNKPPLLYIYKRYRRPTPKRND